MVVRADLIKKNLQYIVNSKNIMQLCYRVE